VLTLKPGGIFWAEIVKNYHFLGQWEKNEKKDFFSKIQLYKSVLDYYGNVWKKFQKL